MSSQDTISQSVGILLKWMHIRDSVCRVFMFLDNTGRKYALRMHMLQQFLKAHMIKTGDGERAAVLALCKMIPEETQTRAQIIAAGYELLTGTDYTTKDNGEYDREMDDDIYD